MTRHEQIVALAREGLDDKAIAEQVGCRREYVRVARRRERARASEPSAAGASKYQRIVALYERGLDDTAIAAEVGCRREYVRVARRRAGLFRAPVRRVDPHPAEEAKLRKKIADLAQKLAAAENALSALLQQAGIAASDASRERTRTRLAEQA
jgi:DNA-binding CsgD family transcriptional regulator